MVAIFTGSSAGLSQSSAATLGAAGLLGSAAQGRGGEQISLNAATGNLVIARQDEFLVGLGPDLAVSRTYNSLAQASDDNGDQWRQSTDRRIFGLTGTVNTAGSTIRRVAGDGAVTDYVWKGSYYETTDGSGAHDRLSFAGGTWTWTDGDSRITELYAAGNASEWRITEQKDSDGNKLTFAYAGDKLTRVTTADGGYTAYSWSGSNITSIVTGYKNGNVTQTLTRTRYSYDDHNRLSLVTTDLSPEDNAIADDRTYATGYRYVGSTNRIAYIGQTDGSRVDFTYDDSGRVTEISQTVASGETRLTQLYYLSSYTAVIDPEGNRTRFYSDAAGQLTRLLDPHSRNTYFAYDPAGNLSTVTDPSGSVTAYAHDGNGNITQITDPNGNVTTREYDANNNLIREYNRGSSATESETWNIRRYAYDAENHLRYTVSGEGRVTEYVYDAVGNRTYQIDYPEQNYQIGNNYDPIGEADLDAWRDAIPDRSSVKILQYIYDPRGNVSRTVDYGSATAAGAASISAGYSSVWYGYDQAGQLLSRYNEGEAAETYLYDGLGRMVSTTAADGGTTSILFQDSAIRTVITSASGLTTTSVYNKAGDLVSQTESGALVQGDTATYRYDANGRVRVANDATGRSSYFLYDALGRKTAEIGHDGQATKYGYDADGRVIVTIRYYNAVTAANMALLADPANSPSVDSIRPKSNGAYDIWQWTVYDEGGRVMQTIAADGAVTDYGYDKADRLISTKSYATKLDAAAVYALKSELPTAPVTVTADPALDSLVRHFYDRDGRLIGTLNPEGYLTESVYDAAGQKVRDIRYTIVTRDGYRETQSLRWLRDRVAPDAAVHQRTNYVYDGQGQLIFTVDDDFKVSQFNYNVAGKVTDFLQYDGAIDPGTTDFSYDNIRAVVIDAGLYSQGARRRSFTVYNALGQVAYEIDATGGVTGFVYDGSGRVAKTLRFAARYGASTLKPVGDLDAWAAANGADVRIDWNYYNARDELRWTIDAEGYATQIDYDAEGRVTRQARHPVKLAPTDSWTALTLNNANMGTPAETRYAYDNLGRLSDVTDPAGVHSVTGYYANGAKQYDIRAHGEGAQESRTTYSYDAAGKLIQQTDALGQSTSYAYDGLGNLVSLTDPRGNITGFTYDRNGQVLTRTDALGGTTAFQYDARGNAVKTTDARGNASLNYYDGSNRLILSVDAEGYGTRTTYNNFDEIESVTRLYNRASGTPAVGTQPAFAPHDNDAATSFLYDRLGRLVKTTDAFGEYESYTLDAFGQRIAVRNKLGGVTTNAFDKRGLLIAETTPADSYDANGVRLSTTTTNRFEYDSRGNRVKMIEADGLPEERTTFYGYDLMDRLVRTVGDQVYVYAQGDTNNRQKIALTENYAYDARGNLIESVDPVGARTLYYYDALDRVTHQISATGTLTRNFYDANGNVAETRVYATQVALPAAGGTPPNGSGPDRRTLFVYDANDRLTESKVPSVQTGSYVSSLAVQVQDLSTQYSYDAAGNVLTITDPNGTKTYNYYDRLGRKSVSVDAENYRTDWSYDADGNVLSERRYEARAAAATIAAPPAVARNDNSDRITNFTYDMNGRRLTETRLKVLVYSAGGAVRWDSTIHYFYNALGQVISKSEATGEYSAYRYDDSGRLTQERRSGYAGYAGPVTPTVDYFYNGLNDLSRVQQADRVTRYIYDKRGRLAQTIDPTGFSRNYGYDAASRVTRESYVRATPAGNKSEGIGYIYDLEGRVTKQGVMQADSAGWSLGAAGSLTGANAASDVTNIRYNAFGEVTARGINGLQERLDYDDAGRLWRTTSEDGTWKYFLYDANGNQSLTVATAGADIANKTIAQVLDMFGGAALVHAADVDGVNATLTRYDKRNQAIVVREPRRQLYSTKFTDLTTTRSYNAFGEVAGETDARGARIDYSYNNMGRLIRTESPTVQITLANGSTQYVRPAEDNYYDASGRLIATRDANGGYANGGIAGAGTSKVADTGNLTRRSLLAGTGYGGSEALVTAITFADGGTVNTLYDVHGNARTVTDQIGRVTTQGFDALGRVTQVNHAGNLVETFTYDGLGQRVTANDNNQTSTVGERIYYDQQGRVVARVEKGGDTTTIDYAWDGSLWNGKTEGRGGWRTVTQYANLKTMTVEADLYGRDLKRVDLGGHVSTLSYDRAGRLTREAVSYGGKGVGDDYAWLNTGRLGGVVRTWRSGDGALHRQNAVYRYDAAGNKTYENTVETVGGAARTIQNQGASYDALGRMTSWSQGGDGPPRASTAFAYDANGNVRRTYTQYRPLDAQGNPAGSASYRDYYYAFDSMNRLVTDKGQLVGGAIRRGWTGTDYLYDVAGQRVRAVNTAWREAHYQVYGDQRAAPPPPDQAAAQAGADTDNEAALLLAQIAAETLAAETLAAQASAAGLAATDGAALAIADDGGAEDGADDGAAPAGLDETAAVPDEATLLRLAALRAEAEAPTETGAQAPDAQAPDAQNPDAQAPDAQDPGAQGGAFAPGPEADRVWVPGEDPADTEVWPDLPPTLADARPLPGNPVDAETPGNPLPAETPGTPVDAETPDIPPYAAPLDAAPLYAAPLDAAPLYAAPEAAMSPASLAGDPPPADSGTDPQGTDPQGTDPGTDPQGYVPPPTLPDPGDGDGWHVASDWYAAEVRESYGYDAAGNLVSVRVAASGYEDNHDGSYTVTPPPGTGVLRAGYGYDRLGRQTTQIDYEANGTSVAYQKKTTWNGKGQAVYEAVITARADGVTRSDTTYSFVKPDGSGYALGAPVLAETANYKAAPGATGMIVQPASRTETDYVWFDGARAGAVRYRADTDKPAVFTTAYDYGIDGDLGGITVNDGRPRSISYVTDVNRQIVARDESDSSAATSGDPHEIWYRFNGVEMGYTGNNGTGTSAQVAGITSEYAASIADRQRAEPAPTSQGGAFRLGHANGAADFEQSSAPITSYDQGSVAGDYVVRGGDTLAGIAAGLWGDASLWYKLAEANPGIGAGALTAGQRLRLPSGVLRATFNASTFKPYDPANGIGDVQPTTPQPQKAGHHKKGCGIVGSILTVVIAAAVAWALPPLAAGLGPVLGSAVQAAAVSTITQSITVATGIQEKFSFKGVALAAVSAGVSAGLASSGAFGKLGIAGEGFLAHGARGLITEAATQGVAAATGLQGKFDWAGVAAAGVGAAAGRFAGGRTGIGGLAIGADSLASAAARSLITGTDFGDNVVATLPSVIGRGVTSALGTPLWQRVAEARAEASGGGGGGGGSGAAWSPGGGRYSDLGLPGYLQSQGIGVPTGLAALRSGLTVNASGGWLDSPGSFLANLKEAGQGLVDGFRNLIDSDGDGSADTGTIVVIGERIAKGASRIGEAASVVYRAVERSLGAYGGARQRAQSEGNRAIARQYSQLDQRYQVTTRLSGGVQAVFGGFEVVGGLAAAGVGGGGAPFTGGASLVVAVGGGALATAGVDNMQAGARQASTGRVTQTFGGQVIAATGVSPVTAEMSYGLVQGAGGIAVGRAAFNAARPASYPLSAINGNSLNSPKTAYLYRLDDNKGNLLKWGITQNEDVTKRYTNAFLQKKDIYPVASGSRLEMSQLERAYVEQNPGPLNLEPWAVAARKAGRGQ